jgi:hypothetical protein
MSRATVSRTLAIAIALLGVLATGAQAHLVASGSDTLLGMMAGADGMVVARSAAATHTRDEKSAATAFLAREVVAGVGPEDAFVLDQDPPILRYAELQDVLLLVARRTTPSGSVRWLSAQPAGAAIVLATPVLPEPSRVLLKRLWTIAHAAAPGDVDPAAAVSALIDALSLPEQKLRALAYLDLARLATDPEHFSTAAIARLTSYGDRPGDDAQLASAVHELGERLQRGASTSAPTAKADGVKP